MIILFLNRFIFKNLWSVLNFSESLLCSLFENCKVNIFRVSTYCLFSSFWRHRGHPSSLCGLASLEPSSLCCPHSAIVCSLQGEPSIASLWIWAWGASQTTFSSLWGGSLCSPANRAPEGDRRLEKAGGRPPSCCVIASLRVGATIFPAENAGFRSQLFTHPVAVSWALRDSSTSSIMLFSQQSES